MQRLNRPTLLRKETERNGLLHSLPPSPLLLLLCQSPSASSYSFQPSDSYEYEHECQHICERNQNYIQIESDGNFEHCETQRGRVSTEKKWGAGDQSPLDSLVGSRLIFESTCSGFSYCCCVVLFECDLFWITVKGGQDHRKRAGRWRTL
jgi:hypothetical protein